MKKFLALVLTVVMAASLAACGNSGKKETQAPASGDSETAAESTAAESTGETAEKVAIQKLSSTQNQSWILLCNISPKSGSCRKS